MGIFGKILGALKKTKDNLSSRLSALFSKNKLGDEFYDELEEILISADISVTTAEEIIDQIRAEAKAEKLKDKEFVVDLLKDVIEDLLLEAEQPDIETPAVIMLVGVNGVGKTTTIGKLANYFVRQKKSVTLAAADTFRAAAAEQLGVSSEELATWTAEAAGEEAAIDEAAESTGAEGDAAQGGESSPESISEEARTRLEDIDSLAESMSDEDAVIYYLEKHPDLKGCFATNDETVLLGARAVKSMEKTDEITVMGFDAGKDQLDALSDGSIDGLVVQNPFGMGYAAVVAAARTVLEIGNEAQVDTGFVWVDAENMKDESLQPMLYE